MREKRSSWLRGRKVAGALGVAALVALFAELAVQTSHAAPSDPTLTTAQLQAKLDASGTVPGYFKTVLKGTDITSIPVNVLAITAVGNSTPPKLIMFEATGAAIAKIGGIAAGMSGSPLYVPIWSAGVETDYLVGAVSYGDYFTLGGQGLATPIEYMAALETDPYGVKMSGYSLAAPVQSAAGPIAKIVIAPTDPAARAARAKGTLVAKPLLAVQIGGLPASSSMFLAYKKFMAKHGVDAVAAPSASGGYDPSLEATLEGGAAVAALSSRGDLWAGAAGTITYATSDTVVAFGHPLNWEGKTGLTLANAWVDGVWQDSMFPYKLIAPTKVRGIFTQDRSAGIAGRTDILPQETPVTARATMIQDSKTATATSYLPRWAADSPSFNYMGLPMMAAYLAPARAIDAAGVAATALTTSTVVVTDGTTTYTVTRPNIFDDPNDVAYASVMDVDQMASAFQQLNAPDIKKAHVISVDFSTSISTTRQAANIVGVDVPGGVKPGVNDAKVLLKVRGVAATQTVDSVFTIPQNMPLSGTVYVTSNDLNQSWFSNPFGGVTIIVGTGSTPDNSDLSVADVAKDLRSLPKNSDLQISYTTGMGPLFGGGSSSGGVIVMSQGRSAASAAAVPTSVDVTAATPWYLRNLAVKSAARVSLMTARDIVSYGGSTKLLGTVSPTLGDTTITILGRSPDQATDTTLAQIPATTTDSGFASFHYSTKSLAKDTTFTAIFSGDTDSLGSRASLRVAVRARVTLSASPSNVIAGRTTKLTATVTQHQLGVVGFERLARGRWHAIRWVALSHGKATLKWKVGRGAHRIRAEFAGGTLNARAMSSIVQVRGR